MDEFSALSYAPILSQVFSNSAATFENTTAELPMASVNRATFVHSQWNGFNNIPKGSIVIIPVSGALMKNDQACGPKGMSTIGSIIKEADSNSNVDGIILKIDSPGGSVDGTAALAEIVAATNKPIVAFADGLTASAALWIAASADEIIAANNKTQIGSIGVLLSFADIQPALEKQGIVFHKILADQSKDKTKVWDELKSGNYESFKKEVLNPLAEDFISHMKSARPDILEKHLTGKLYFAQDVIGSLVDSIGNLDYAIGRVNSLIENSNSNNNSIDMKLDNINSTIGAELQSTDEGAFLNVQQLEAIENALNTEDAPEESSSENTEESEAASNEESSEETSSETAIDPKDKIIADLKKTIQVLNSSARQDKEVVKSKDGNQSSANDDFISAVASAQELNDLVDSLN